MSATQPIHPRKTEEAARLYADIEKIKRYFHYRLTTFPKHYPHLEKESKHLFFYDIIAGIVDLLEEDLHIPRSAIFDLIIDNDEYNRYQRIKAINLPAKTTPSQQNNHGLQQSQPASD
ncbi:hypothetical protein D6783_00405 [Candidatus Woesearchaeota archaeon]|nr:MAG: hypothetical protein D6783_00405 [Candidatus Woesearchaeota archaeon]